MRAGRERGLRAPLRRRAGHRARHRPDRLRGRLAARPHQPGRGPDRRPPLRAGRHREHGQRDRRPGARRGWRHGRRPRDAAGCRRRRADPRGDRRRRARHDQLRGHLRAAAPRDPPHGRRRDVSAALDAARDALRGERAWVVGGAVRDRLLGRPLDDIDLVVDGDVRAAARHLALQAGGPSFPLSDAHGAWRVHGPDRAWQIDLAPLRDGTIEADLALRDFTVNAIAEPLQGGPLLDPHGGAEDLVRRRLRMVGRASFPDDPLRVLRLARFASELDLEPEPPTVAAAREHAPGIERVAAERVFAELRRIVACDRPVEGLALMEDLGLTARVLPELAALHGVEQNVFHDADVHDHTMTVLRRTCELQADPGAVLGEEHGAALTAFLARPLSDELTRGTALRFGALLHDIAKPACQAVRDDGTVLGFPDHDREGARLARAILERLRTSDRLRTHVAALARHHLRLGFLVHHRPVERRRLHAYLVATGPVALDVTLLSVADRLATTGRDAERSIAVHLELARELLPAVRAWEDGDRPAPLVRGDELAAALDLRPGPLLGELLAELAAAGYAGEVTDRDGAVAHARAWLAAREG
ncbi:hypothetical protein C7Y72_15440 [Paraconexibacter algicola]|uniref:HD/PDEase domain-containing protein n=1 Tax=Paraconexibacter algicola TaxID=2133960 RepID=A0A2T4UF08_9ACTN|nr:hypothetical protein C7Y72_15440 [Paraconexibacter algicola]